jgi:Flp pilus assembly protein CpaB
MNAKQPTPVILTGSIGPSNRGLWLSIILGILAAVANLAYANYVQGTKLTVLKANRRLTVGRKVTPSDFTKIVIYGEDLKQMKSLVVEESEFSALAQAPLSETLEPGQLLLQSSFTFSGRGFRDAIGAEERAIALHVKDETSAVAYFVRPGDVVDVWAKDSGAMRNIISSAVVRAVGDATIVAGENAGGERQYRTVTVVVPTSRVGEVLDKLNATDGNVTLALAGASGS